VARVSLDNFSRDGYGVMPAVGIVMGNTGVGYASYVPWEYRYAHGFPHGAAGPIAHGDAALFFNHTTIIADHSS